MESVYGQEKLAFWGRKSVFWAEMWTGTALKRPEKQRTLKLALPQ